MHAGAMCGAENHRLTKAAARLPPQPHLSTSRSQDPSETEAEISLKTEGERGVECHPVEQSLF